MTRHLLGLPVAILTFACGLGAAPAAGMRLEAGDDPPCVAMHVDTSAPPAEPLPLTPGSGRVQSGHKDGRAGGPGGKEIDAIANVGSDEGGEGGGVAAGGSKFYAGVKGFVGGGYEVFLKYNLGGLSRIAGGRDARRREWLRQFLDCCRDAPRKRALLLALRK